MCKCALTSSWIAEYVKIQKCLRTSSHGNTIVLFHLCFNIWNRQIGCSHMNGMIAYQFCFVLRQEHNHSVDMSSICLLRQEWNNYVLFHFLYHFFSCPIFCNGTILFEMFPSEGNPSAFHFSKQKGTRWNDCIPV